MVQKQILAPRMIQSMEILQLPILALQERIEQEMEENPVLELQEEEPEVATEEVEPEEHQPPDAPTEEERELVIDEAHSNEGDFERLMKMDEEWPDHFEERSHGSRGEIEEAGERKLDAMANMAARPQSLQDYLHDQLGWFDLEPALRAMADRIIYNLDANGYVQGRLEDLLGPDAGEEELVLARQALALVQKLDPPGVGARDLSECLLLQLVPGVPHYEQLQALIANHLEDLEHNRLPAISRRTGYSLELIQEVLGELRKLNPKPVPTSATSSSRRSRPTSSLNWTKTASTACVWRKPTRPACSSAPTTASFSKTPPPVRKPATTSSARSIRPNG